MKKLAILAALLATLLAAAGALAAPASTDADASVTVPSEPYRWESPDKANPFNVAIFRDALPWGLAIADQVLMENGISFTVFGSADMGVVDLAGFDKVILSSNQSAAFVAAVVANNGWFESYAGSGGYLLESLCHQPADIPAGTIYPGFAELVAWNSHSQVARVEPSHPVFTTPNAVTDADLSNWSSSSHGDLDFPGATVLANHDDGTGTFCLAEGAYGYGHIMATTQTFEFSGANPAAVENMILHRLDNPALPQRVAIFQDSYPWGVTTQVDVFNDHLIPYIIFDSADIGVVDLSGFDRVILANNQPAAFVDAVLANRAWFENWVSTDGRVLINGMSQQNGIISAGDVYPGGVEFTEWDGSNNVTLTLPGSPVFNTPNSVTEADLTFNFAHHGLLDGAGRTVLAVSTTAVPAPILVEQAWGDGFIVSTTITDPLNDAPFAENLALYTPGSFPRVTAVSDVADDQGRQVRLMWDRSGYDSFGSPVAITGYEIHRRQDAAKAAGWDFLMSVPAHGDAVYQAVVPTLCDSTIGDGLCESTFRISAVTASPFVSFFSAEASGYSVDNLAPAVPADLVVAGGTATWQESPADDFDYFTVYESATGTMADAVPVGRTTGTSLAIPPGHDDYLLVTATDFAGNESEPALAGSVSAVDGMPAAFRVLGASPNPFNPSTTIRFELPAARDVDLRVFDAAGRVVRNLLDGRPLTAGPQRTVWDGRDDAGRTVATGVYYFRLSAGPDMDTGRMVLLK